MANVKVSELPRIPSGGLSATDDLIVNDESTGVTSITSFDSLLNSIGTADLQVTDSVASAQTAATMLPDGTFLLIKNYSTIGDGGGFFAKTMTTPDTTSHPDAANITFADTSFLKAASFGLKPRSDINVEEFGVSNSVALNKAIKYCIDNLYGTLIIDSGRFDFDNQITETKRTTGTPGINLVGQGSSRTRLYSHVQGPALGQDTDGYLFKMDGLRESVWKDFTINFEDGNGGIVAVCQSGNLIKNSFLRVDFLGSDKEDTTKRSFKFIGQQLSASGNWINYHNHIEGCKFNSCYTHVDYITGDFGDDANLPNQNNIGDYCLFERYIIGVNFNDADECFIGKSFFQQAFGVSGVNGGVTYAVSTNGEFMHLDHRVEGGAGAKTYYIGPNADRITGCVMDNNSVGPVLDPANTSERIFIQSYSNFDGVLTLNRSGRHDLHIFGDGNTASASNTVAKRVNIFGKAGTDDQLSLGVDDSTGFPSVTAIGANLDLRPQPATSGAEYEVFLGDSNWDGRTVRLSNYRLWVDSTGALRIKLGRPTSVFDGDVVGAQT